MGTRYKAIAGQRIDRLAALSDGLFAILLMAEFITLRTALLLYWFNIFASGAILLVSWRYAVHTGLVRRRSPAPSTGR